MDLTVLQSNPELAKDITLTVKGNDLLIFANALVKETAAEVEARLKAQEKENELLTRNQVCEMLDVTLPTLWRWEKKEILIPVKIGNKVRYRRSDVEAILNK